MTTNNLFVELSESDMAATTGGVISAIFLNRWAARARNGNPNFARISQRLVNEFYKSGLTPTSASSWLATASDADKTALKNLSPLVSTFLSSNAAIAGATPAAISAVRSYLGLI